MLIATFNVNSVRSRLHILERWLEEVKPDMLFMQETKTQDKTFPEEFFMSCGYRSYYHGEKMHNGVAVLVRDLDVHVTFGFSDGEYDTRVLTLTYKDMIILNAYVPQGRDIEHRDYDRKKEFFSRVREIVASNLEGKFIWLGDMNVAPELIDVTRPEKKKNHVCFTEEIRRIYADTKRGLIDLHRKFHPYERIYTFYDYRVKDAVKRQIGWRIDHILASERLSERVKSCNADIRLRECERPSDHVPLICEIEV